MATTTCGRLSFCGQRRNAQRTSYGVDKTVNLKVDGTHQQLRLCAARTGLPPVLIVQAGPGFPVLNEVEKFQQRLQLEQNFLVAYWDQRGCGPASLRDTQDVSLKAQVDDLCFVLRWLEAETGEKAVVLGISLGATIALQAAAQAADSIKALVAVSIDADTASSDTSARSFLQEQIISTDNRKLARLVKKLGAPPYTDPASFQLRARLLTELGTIEHGKRFGELLRGLLHSLVRTYGWLGAARTLRNMNTMQRMMLPEIATLNMFENWPCRTVPVHYIFGESDPLVPASLIQKVLNTITPDDSVTSLPNTGHMAHFDQPAVVRSIVAQAHLLPNVSDQ
jgi:pimeloyl-ACP methyl ester carboxylesterase